MFYNIRNYSVLFAALVFLIVSCNGDQFKINCIEMHSILKDSMKLTKLLETKNVYDEKGKITGTKFEYDNSKAIEFLKNNNTRLLDNYEKIKAYSKSPNEHYYDALFALAYFNLLIENITGQPIEDRCLFITMIPKRKNIVLSGWLVDDIVGNIFNIRNSYFKKEWQRLEYKEKYSYILHFLNSPTRQERKCISIPGEEKYNRFPPNNLSQ